MSTLFFGYVVPYGSFAFLGGLAGWYGHMHFGAKAQAVANSAAAVVSEVKKDI
jgi:hypothetical protein